MSARTLFISAALLACLTSASFEAHVLLGQRQELQLLQQRTAQAAREAAALRREGESARAELTASEAQLAASSTVLARAPGSPGDSAESARHAETQAWLARVKQLQRLFDERPAQRIPELQALDDADWLRVAKSASFADEHATRRALGDLRSAAKQKFFARLGSAFRTWSRNAGGQPPSSILALASHFDSPPDPAALQRYEILLQAAPGSGRAPELTLREKDPVDAYYDTRTTMRIQAAGGASTSTIVSPFAWLPDFERRNQDAYRAYAAAHPARQPTSMVDVIPYFNPPLDPALSALIVRFERERQQ